MQWNEHFNLTVRFENFPFFLTMYVILTEIKEENNLKPNLVSKILNLGFYSKLYHRVKNIFTLWLYLQQFVIFLQFWMYKTS